MFQEIAPKTFYNQYDPRPPKDGDRIFAFSGRTVLAGEDRDNPFPKYEEFKDKVDFEEGSLLYLFRVDDEAAFIWYPDSEVELSGYQYRQVFEMRFICHLNDLFFLFTAFHLYVWYRDNRFCGRCGGPVSIGKKERSLTCSCGNVIYPKLAPAVIVAVRNGDKLLMTRYANRPVKNWALIAGFCEIGETVEETVAREVMEEAGVRVKNIKYFYSQPWGIDINLLMGYYCEVDGDPTIRMDDNELSEAVWMDRADIAPQESVSSLTATMIEIFRLGRDKEPYVPGSLL